MNPHTYGQLIFSNGSKNIQWKNDSLFSKSCSESWTATSKPMKSEHTLTPTQNKLKVACVCVSHLVVSDSLRPRGLQLARLLCPWNSPDKNTGVGCHFFLQGIFPTQGSNSGLLHCRQMLYHLSYQGSWLKDLNIRHTTINSWKRIQAKHFLI